MPRFMEVWVGGAAISRGMTRIGDAVMAGYRSVN